MTPRTEPRLPFRVAHALLLVLAAALPFEVPLCRVGPLQLTTVEIVLYATLAAWGLGTALSVLRNPATARTLITTARESPLVAATLLWTAVLFASALAAPSYRAEAMKFALRTLSGVLVFFAARSLAATTQATRRVLHALLTGAIVSAATAVLESAAPSSAALWSAFHDHGFDTLGLRRASGVFGYPTIGAMYWEAAVPLSVVAPFAFADLAPLPGEATPSSRVARVAPVAGTLLLFLAIFASATRFQPRRRRDCLRRAPPCHARVGAAGISRRRWRARCPRHHDGNRARSRVAARPAPPLLARRHVAPGRVRDCADRAGGQERGALHDGGHATEHRDRDLAPLRRAAHAARPSLVPNGQ